ncbi:hypothetical protein V497_04033 [Pseudogymnoascus sp. VKM F-4516 (FW-969)]|nr:hypothetical protein V497_04033 [Pseudogymnoascus sp. VKM F-4516 (FW-969)]
MRFASSLVAASFLASGLAVPLSTTESSSVAKLAAIDPTLFENIKYYAQYAAATYCSNNANSSGTPITCEADNCPDVEAANAVSVLEFDNSIITDQQGFLSVSTIRKEIVLAFKGSASIRNFLADLNFALVDFGCPGCKAHVGFTAAWLEPRSAILAALAKTRAQYPDYKIVTTGHSLGGAVATLAALELRSSGYEVDLYTYGSPRTGNAAFATFVSAQPGINARVTHVNDLAPRVPPMILGGYRHTTPEYWLSTGGPTTTDYTPEDVKVCTGIATRECNGSTLRVSIVAHLYYFVSLLACVPEEVFETDVLMSPALEANRTAIDGQVLEWIAADAAASPSDLSMN